ncbi:MAG: aminomethyl-transferring glycine dehydrogenase subunit GcvPA [Candidatus Brocadiales bacterium]
MVVDVSFNEVKLFFVRKGARMDYVPHTDKDKKEMLKEIGVDSTDGLFRIVPEELRKVSLDITGALSEQELLAHLKAQSRKNCNLDEYIAFLGAGTYEHFCPSIVDHLSSRGEFLTCYTPYQAEASQGTLQAIYEFQTLVAELTAMDVANASLYDGASALAEAALLAFRYKGSVSGGKVVVSKAVHPEYREVLRTYLRPLDVSITEVEVSGGITDAKALRAVVDTETAAVLVQNPNFFGCLEEDLGELSAAAHEKGALLVSCVNPISLGIIRPPGEYDADIAVGDAQPLGNQPFYGGPHVGFFAVNKKFMRKMPGRLVGLTNDVEGRRGFVLTLQAREQHIRRQRATSNICTNQNLLALRACIYLSALGKEGLRELAELNLQKSHYAMDQICNLNGFEPLFDRPFFNEFAVKLPKGLESRISSMLFRGGIIGGLPLGRFYRELEGAMLFCVTEEKTKADIDKLVKALREASGG